jgi:hypothetical protein
MKAAGFAEAIICIYTAITEVLPPQCRRSVVNIMSGALAEGIVKDDDARELIGRLVASERRDMLQDTDSIIRH